MAVAVGNPGKLTLTVAGPFDSGPLPGGGALAVSAVPENDAFLMSQLAPLNGPEYAELAPCWTAIAQSPEAGGEQLAITVTVTWLPSLDRVADLMNRPGLYCPLAALSDAFVASQNATDAKHTPATTIIE